ncbi:RNA recognition motif domain containing protein [Entamoeba marina]
MQTSLTRALKVNCTTTLFFARLGTTTKNELEKFCNLYGPVKDITMMIDNETQKAKGCAFVKFMTHEDAQKCVNEAPHKNANDATRRGWVIEWAKSSAIKENDLDKTTIYISCLNELNHNEEALHEKFSKYGDIEKISIPENNKARIAFIRFKSMENAAAAINGENGKLWMGKLLVVEFSETIQSKRARRQKATLKKQNQISHKSVYQFNSNYSYHPQPSHRATKSSTSVSVENIQIIPSHSSNNSFSHSTSPIRDPPYHKHSSSQPFPTYDNPIPYPSYSDEDEDTTELPIFRELSSPASEINQHY